jgi:hypothetical protein
MKEVKTKQDYVDAHRKLWGWLAEHPLDLKRDWPGWERNGGEYRNVKNRCFACEFTVLMPSSFLDCKNCLFVWPDEEYGIYGCQREEDGLFDLWEIAFEDDNLSEMVEFAKQIRDLPVRSES